MRYFFLFLATPLLLLLYFSTIFWNWIAFRIIGYFGISASPEADGIRLSNHVKTSNRLLAWEDISEVNEVFKPPFFTLEILLKSGELVIIYFGTVSSMELYLENHDILFRKIN